MLCADECTAFSHQRSRWHCSPSRAFAAPAPALAADGITRGTVYKDGPDNRYLLGGEWLFRLDNGQGTPQRFQRQT